jgi:GDP-D-mannose dehydratase
MICFFTILLKLLDNIFETTFPHLWLILIHCHKKTGNFSFKFFGLNYRDSLVAHSKFFRPFDIQVGSANPAKASKLLGWRAQVKVEVVIGNMDAKRDWGHAKDYVEMQWLMLQQEKAEDFVIASGEQYSVRDFVDAAAEELGMEIKWKGNGLAEKGYDVNGKCIVAVDPRYFRPTEFETLLGDATKAREKLGWTPKISFKEMVVEMVSEDLKSAKRDELVKKSGYNVYNYHE